MPLNTIAPDKLARLIGTAHSPRVIDIRTADERSISGYSLPAATLRDVGNLSEWGPGFADREAIIVCTDGKTDSPGAASLLRHHGVDARTLEGGFKAWEAQGLSRIDFSKVPRPKSDAPSLWVTRMRPKVDRVACPWLIRRFVDPDAVFLFVSPTEIPAVAERFGAAPFDVDGVFWSHRGETCTFDTMVDEFGLADNEALARLAVIVRGADTGRLDLAPQAAGLLAVSLGLSRVYANDLQQLEAGLSIYDALFRWCRDAVDETHDWVSHQPKKGSR
ncbi:MAG: sulfurtransferase [Sphingomonadales bacterium 63-6]|nr:MAG: sulfurtransferase [Sphingomonadales bacterium 63-6]